MKLALQILNSIERTGVIGRYAIGGAMGAAFYAEPVVTFDLDVFVSLPETASGIVLLSPIYESLRAQGFAEEGECVTIGGVPVQFLPVYDALTSEAVQDAQELPFDDVTARVMRVEHLIAIAVQTGRPKDRDRVRMLVGAAEFDARLLADVIGRHGLSQRWKEWARE